MVSDNNNKDMLDLVDTPYMKLWKREGVLYCEYHNNLQLDLQVAQECVEARIKYSAGISYPVCIYLTGVKSATKEAREYLAEEGTRLVKAGALIIGSPVTKILGNIFLRINKPEVPTHLFNNEEDAIEWLKQFVEK